MTQEVVDRLLDRIQTAIFTPEPPAALFSGPIHGPQDALEKHSILKPVSRAARVRKATPRASKKHHNPAIESPKNDAKTRFLQYFPYDNLVLRAPTVNNTTRKTMQKVTWKQAQNKHRNYSI